MSKKQELLDAEEHSWREISMRFDKLGDADWERSGVNEEWCAKDLLGHIAVWHAVTTDRFESFRTRGEMPPAPDTDAFNADQVAKCRELSLHDVRAMSGAARHRFREEIALIPEPFSELVERIITVNAHGHYDEHIAHLDAFLGAS